VHARRLTFHGCRSARLKKQSGAVQGEALDRNESERRNEELSRYLDIKKQQQLNSKPFSLEREELFSFNEEIQEGMKRAGEEREASAMVNNRSGDARPVSTEEGHRSEEKSKDAPTQSAEWTMSEDDQDEDDDYEDARPEKDNEEEDECEMAIETMHKWEQEESEAEELAHVEPWTPSKQSEGPLTFRRIQYETSPITMPSRSFCALLPPTQNTGRPGS